MYVCLNVYDLLWLAEVIRLSIIPLVLMNTLVKNN